MSRKPIPMKNKLAACLLTIGQIDYQKSKVMTADEILSMFEWDHWPVRVADAPEGFDINAPWNLKPRIIGDHAEKTKHDLREIAKRKRIVKRAAAHERAMASKMVIEKTDTEYVTRVLYKDMRPKIRSRGFQKGHRPMRRRK